MRPLGAVAIAIVLSSCSLSLDESLIGRNGDGAGGPDGGGVAPGIEAGVDGGSTTELPTTCAADDACTTTDPCLKGRCDLARGACVYDVCRPAACSAAVCDAAAKRCGAPLPYTYESTQFPVGAPVLSRGAVAMYPWLFVLTNAGPIVFDVSNPSGKNPRRVPLAGLGFVPTQMVQSANRVWMIGGASGPGPSRLPIAWIDPPSDPFATTLTARTVLATFDRPAAEGLGLFAGATGSALAVGPIGAQLPSFVVTAPVAEQASFTSTPFLPIMNGVPVAGSGRRLLLSAVTSSAASFQLVDGAGTNAPVPGAITTVPGAGLVSTSRAFGASPDGAVFWASGVHVDQGAGDIRTRAVRGSFLLANQTSPLADFAFDVEVFDAPGMPLGAEAPVTGATVAMPDAQTAILVTPAREAIATQIAVQFAKREPLGIVKEPGGAPRRRVANAPLSAVAATTASNGMGFVVTNDGAPATNATVRIFDPACAP